MEERTMTFEQSLARLDEIVRKMERGDAALDEALALFEEGTALAARCNRLLDDAELRVTQLTKGADGAPVETERKNNDV